MPRKQPAVLRHQPIQLARPFRIAAQDFSRADFKVPLALVLGSEGEGLGRLVREKCDYLVRLPMWGKIDSLNVAVAGSIVLFAAKMQRSA